MGCDLRSSQEHNASASGFCSYPSLHRSVCPQLYEHQCNAVSWLTLSAFLCLAVQAYYLRIGLPKPDEDTSKVAGKWLLVWSGSTSVGQYAIQLAKLSGLKVATTASPKKHDLVKSLGADFVVDYKDPEVVSKLKEATGDAIVYGIDTIAEGGSIQLAQQAFSKEGGHLMCTLFDLKDLPRPEVKTESTLVYTAACGDRELCRFATPDATVLTLWSCRGIRARQVPLVQRGSSEPSRFLCSRNQALQGGQAQAP